MNDRIHPLLIVVFLLHLLACNKVGDEGLQGAWENNKGQVLVFQENGEMLWIQPMREAADTFYMKYRLDETAQPNTVDFYSIENGPFKGKKIYGLAEFTSEGFKRAIRLNIRVGADETSRPESLESGKIDLYVKKR